MRDSRGSSGAPRDFSLLPAAEGRQHWLLRHLLGASMGMSTLQVLETGGSCQRQYQMGASGEGRSNLAWARGQTSAFSNPPPSQPYAPGLPQEAVSVFPFLFFLLCLTLAQRAGGPNVSITARLGSMSWVAEAGLPGQPLDLPPFLGPRSTRLFPKGSCDS